MKTFHRRWPAREARTPTLSVGPAGLAGDAVPRFLIVRAPQQSRRRSRRHAELLYRRTPPLGHAHCKPALYAFNASSEAVLTSGSGRLCSSSVASDSRVALSTGSRCRSTRSTRFPLRDLCLFLADHLAAATSGGAHAKNVLSAEAGDAAFEDAHPPIRSQMCRARAGVSFAPAAGPSAPAAARCACPRSG